MGASKNIAVSAFEIAASLIFLLISAFAWIDISQSTAGILAPLLWGLALLFSFNLLFISLASLVWGWTSKMEDDAWLSLTMAGIAFFAIAAGRYGLGILPLQGGVGFPGGSVLWVVGAAAGFAFGWLGMARKRFLK